MNVGGGPWALRSIDWTAHDDTYVVDGENVVVLARYTATNRATGKDLDVRVAHHFIVRGGRIVRFEQFVTPLRAGLLPQGAGERILRRLSGERSRQSRQSD